MGSGGLHHIIKLAFLGISSASQHFDQAWNVYITLEPQQFCFNFSIVNVMNGSPCPETSGFHLDIHQNCENHCPNNFHCHHFKQLYFDHTPDCSFSTNLLNSACFICDNLTSLFLYFCLHIFPHNRHSSSPACNQGW